MAILFDCQHCGQMLRAVDVGVGQKARCPACGERVRVPELADQTSEFPGPEPLPALPWDRLTQRSHRPPSRFCLLCGSEVDPEDEECWDCGEPLTSRSSGRPTTIRRFAPKTVLKRAVRLSIQRFPLLSGAALLVYLISAMIGLLTIAITSFIATVIADHANAPQQWQDSVIVLASTSVIAGAVIAAFWLYVGWCRLVLRVVRNEEASLTMVFSGGPYLLRQLSCHTLYRSTMAMSGLFFVLPALIVGLLFWPFQWLILDRDLSSADAIRESVRHAVPSCWQTLALSIVTIPLIAVGLASNGLGLFVVIPFLSLTWCVAYDEIVGGTIEE